MVQLFRQAYAQYGNSGQNTLLVMITDGCPSDASKWQLKQTLINKPSNIFLSMVECTDNEEDMDYLSGWDNQIVRYHNQEDYGEELRMVRAVQGRSFKFTRANYVQMIVLSPVFPKYRLDMRGGGRGRAVFGNEAKMLGGNPNYYQRGNYAYTDQECRGCSIM